MTNSEAEAAIREFVREAYPTMEVRIRAWDQDPSRRAVYFQDQKFSLLYPMQRFHYLSHLIPRDFQEIQLANSVWFELAPGERPEDLQYPDDEIIQEIQPFVMQILEKTGFLADMDEAFAPTASEREPAVCFGDYRVAKSILPHKGIREDEYFDVFHVLMAQGGYCDCEILYNVYRGGRYAQRYWQNRSQHAADEC